MIKLIGHHASYALPTGIIIGLMIPQAANYLKLFLLPALLIPLTLSLVRIQTNELMMSFKNWRFMILISAWLLLINPLIIWALLIPVDIPQPIKYAAIISAAAPPVTACAAVAIFLRINAAIAVVTTVITMLLVPITLPIIFNMLIDMDVNIKLWQLSLRLSGFILGAFILAYLIKRCLGPERLNASADTLDGISVISISIFIIGIMDGVTALFFQQPSFVIQTLLVAFLVVLVLYFISTLFFWRMGANQAMAVGLCCGNCNLGLMYLVLADQAPLDILIFFAVGQIPLYFLPTLLSPLVNKLSKDNTQSI